MLIYFNEVCLFNIISTICILWGMGGGGGAWLQCPCQPTLRLDVTTYQLRLILCLDIRVSLEGFKRHLKDPGSIERGSGCMKWIQTALSLVLKDPLELTLGSTPRPPKDWFDLLVPPGPFMDFRCHRILNAQECRCDAFSPTNWAVAAFFVCNCKENVVVSARIINT